MRHRMPRQHGFTLLEMLITVTVIASVAVLASPLFLNDDRLRVLAASTVLASDIEMAQMSSIGQPNDSVVVRFDPDNATYWLASSDDTETPINRPDDGMPYLVTFGVGRGAPAVGVTMVTNDIPGDVLAFNAQGAVEPFLIEPSIDLTLGDVTIRLEISPHTGQITETEPESK